MPNSLSSCSTVKTPQLLELSGIGDPKILEPLGIKTVVDLPAVGTNVQERYTCLSVSFRKSLCLKSPHSADSAVQA